jgi:hypothetical protein
LRSHRALHALSEIVKLRTARSQNSNTAVSAGYDDTGQSVFVKALAVLDGFIAQDQHGRETVRSPDH